MVGGTSPLHDRTVVAIRAELPLLQRGSLTIGEKHHRELTRTITLCAGDEVYQEEYDDKKPGYMPVSIQLEDPRNQHYTQFFIKAFNGELRPSHYQTGVLHS